MEIEEASLIVQADFQAYISLNFCSHNILINNTNITIISKLIIVV